MKTFRKIIIGVVQLVLILGVGIVAVWATHFIGTKTPFTTIALQATKPTPFELKDSMASTTIIQEYQNTVANNIKSGEDKVNLDVRGNFASGYLYVVANASGQPLRDIDKDNFDAVFLQLYKVTLNGDGETSGGHLIEADSLASTTSATSTLMLFDLSKVPYKKTFTDSDAEITVGDWLSILNDSTTPKALIAFSSTERGVGTIDKVIFYYTCTPGSDCSISVQK
jgi:hypothetical protein